MPDALKVLSRCRGRFLMERHVATRALAVLLIVLAALVGARAAGAEGGGQNQFPCTPKTLPEAGALLPDLVPDQQLLEDDHVVWRDPQTGQFLLAFSAGIKNLGAGTLNVVGYRDRVAGSALPDPNTMPAYQRIFHADGTCDELLVGTMEYHAVHHHWHLEGVMTYELLNAAGQPVKPNTKVAFCMADVAVVDSSLPGFPTAPAFNGCDPNQRTTYVNTGTSVGWEDIYDKMLFGQNFDVTDLMNAPLAAYFIRQTVDGAGILFEEDNSNNTTEISVMLGIGVPYSTGRPRPGV
jgi:hypothetical protein